MADYRRYQPRRTTSSISGRTVAIWVVAGVLVIAVSTWLFRGRATPTDTGNGPDITLVNDQANTNQVVTNAAVTNTSVTNTAVATTSSLSSATMATILQSCPNAVSQVGTSKRVALTFDIVDDGEAVTRLIDVLKAKSIPAAFFITGTYAVDHGSLLQEIVAAGFPVYSRGTSTSVKFGTAEAATVTSDLTTAEAKISAASGQSAKPFFRPARGETSAAAVTAARQAGFCTITWTVDGNDWDDTQTADGASTRVLDRLTNGAIVLFGAGYEITPTAVETLATEIPKRGYTLSTLAELFTADR